MKSPIQNKMNTVFIHVSNLEEAAIWYTKLLGQELNKEEICLPVFNLDVEGHTGITLDADPDGVKPLSPPNKPAHR
ncbi:VOC family protein [Peribacillus kribbensis]|uniref:VOC family protein n=1 Tax=Peribacillus kribbensis TaxID=356658 RepID=UPI000400837F|nr:hypothetical protein [Peribacillus kribbensis]